MTSERDRLEQLAREYGIDLAKAAGRRFALWLLKRPRIAKRPWLAKLLFRLAGGRVP